MFAIKRKILKENIDHIEMKSFIEKKGEFRWRYESNMICST